MSRSGLGSGADNVKKRVIPVDLRMQRKIALVFIGTGSIFTAIASILGVLMIFGLSFGIQIIGPEVFSVHPYLQIFGFLAEFIFGVAYSLIPSFKSHGLASYKLAYLSFALITAANTGFLISAWLVSSVTVSKSIMYLSLLLELAASLIFLAEVSYVLRNGRKTRLKGDAYILLSAISFFAALSSVIADLYVGRDPFNFGTIYLLLMGFVGSMIFGVVMKTIAVRLTDTWHSAYSPAAYLQCVSVAAAIVYVIFPTFLLSIVVFLLFLSSSVLYILASRTLTQSRLLLPLEERREAHLGNTIGHANLLNVEVSLMSASSWLIVGVLFSLLYSMTGRTWVEIAFIHSLSIGFIGSTIIGIAPVLLPGILSRRSPSGKNTLLPLYLLNAGLIIFVGGDIISSRTTVLPYWTGIGGISIVLSMIVFMYEIHEKLIPTPLKKAEEGNIQEDW